MRVLLACVLALVSAGPFAQSKSPLTLEDYYRVKSAGGVAISPDGAWVTFTVGTRVEADNSTRTQTFVVPSDGSAPPREVLHGGKPTSAPRWESSGLLRYTVDRQSFTIDPAKPTDQPAAAPAPGPAGTVTPDGKWTVVLRDAPAPAKPQAPVTDFEKRHADRFKGVTFDWMEFQRDGQPFPAPDPRVRPAQHLVLRPTSAGGSERVLVARDLRPAGMVWHPNGQLLAFLADADFRNEQAYERTGIWLVSIDGTADRLTDDGYVYSDLDFSPDGKYMSFARTFGTDKVIEEKLNHGGPRDLFVRAVDGTSDPVNLTARWDLEPGQTTWSPDSRFMYFTSAIGGETHLFRVGVPAGRVEQVTKGERRIGALTFDRAMKRIAYTVTTHGEPGEVYSANVDGTGERKLSDVNGTFLASKTIGQTERLRWKSKDGTEIEGWLTHPASFDRARGPAPLIVFSHGGPHSATGYSFDFKKHFFAANGYFVLDTNFRSSTGYGEAFKWATWGAWGDKDGEDVMAGIDYVLSRYPIDRARVGHTGHSYGGFMTNWLITQYPDRFAAAVSGAGISNWISDYGTADIYRTKETEFFGPPWDDAARARMIRQSPITYAGRVRTPTLFVHGEVDQRVPYEEAEQLYFALRRRGIPAKMIRYDGQPHGIGGHWNNVHRMMNELQWWETYLKH
jgi:dipeptidyl aminopeptidase/acylaminoacyl peptidase